MTEIQISVGLRIVKGADGSVALILPADSSDGECWYSLTPGEAAALAAALSAPDEDEDEGGGAVSPEDAARLAAALAEALAAEDEDPGAGSEDPWEGYGEDPDEGDAAADREADYYFNRY